MPSRNFESWPYPASAKTTASMPLFTALVVAALALAATIESGNVTLTPDTAGAANVEWDLVLGIPTCREPMIGRSLSLRFPPPLTLPEEIPPGSALFDGAPVDLRVTGDTLEVALEPELVPQFCLHDRPFRARLVVLPSAGLQNPAEAGSYVIEISTADNPAAFTVPVEVRQADASGSS